MGVPPCSTCKACGSDFAQSPSGHGEPAAHDYVNRYDHVTGVAYEVCRVCMQRRTEIEAVYVAPPKEEPADPYLQLTERFPHCDAYVLHDPQACEYCAMDEFSPLHAWRLAHRVCYTGEEDASKAPCPATLRRSKETIEHWPNNRAHKP